MPRPRHPSKEVEAVIDYAETRGWTLRQMGHWGRLFCTQGDRAGCQVGVSGTPRNAQDHAKQLKRAIDRCPHTQDADDEDV
ncbi:MAG: hypothetical protein ACYDD1_06115 [Caulobacteraceae bacterium]